MTDVTSALDAVGALITERTKYEEWITALASKTDVPPHVLDKVRVDYTGRLRGVLQGFTAYTPSLSTALAEYQSRDAELAAQEKACRDEHAEGQLRHMVGEYDDEQWDQVRFGHEALLARVASDREAIAVDIASVQRSLAAASDAAQRARTLVDGPADPAARDELPTPTVQATMNTNDRPAALYLTEPEPSIAPVTTYRPAPQSPPSELMDRRTQLDDLGFLRANSRSGPLDVAEAALPRVEAPVLRIVADDPSPVAAVTPVASVVTQVDAAKTLKCAECGTMNYPTEWYCERCGGELAVL